MDSLFIFAAKYLFVLPILVLGVYFLLRKWPSQKHMVVFAIPAALLSGLLGFIGNHLYNDPRPFVVGHFTPLIPHVADNGFPSDHTLLVATVAMIAWYWNRKLGIALWLMALLVAIARVYVGVHHPIDVIGSMVFSILGVSVTYFIFTRMWKKEIA